MPRQIGYTTETRERLVLGAGRLIVNFGTANEVALGATRGGGEWTVTQTYRQAEVDGTIGAVKGLKRIIEASVQLTTTLVEFDRDKLLQLFPGAVAGDSRATDPIVTTGLTGLFNPDSAQAGSAPGAGQHHRLSRAGDVSDSDYLTNVALLFEVSRKSHPGVALVLNALQDGPIAVTTEDDGEATVPIQFTGHYDPATPEAEPWQLYLPKN